MREIYLPLNSDDLAESKNLALKQQVLSAMEDLVVDRSWNGRIIEQNEKRVKRSLFVQARRKAKIARLQNKSREKTTLNSINPKIKLSTGTTGAIQELRVAIDLMSKGYEVYRNISPNGKSDLVAILNTRILRVEVKTAGLRSNGTMNNVCIKHPLGYDVLARVTHNGQIAYEPPFP